MISCEHDREWYAKLAPRVPPNVRLLQVDLVRGGDYAKKAGEFPRAFDVVVIDGRDRVNCALHSAGALKPGGVIVWDDTLRDEYKEGIDFLAGRGFARLDFRGMRPINVDPSCTSIFYRPGSCLKI